LGISVYRRTLYQPYSLHLTQNSSRIISGIQKANGKAGGVIRTVLTFLSAIVMLIAVLGTLIVADPAITLIAFTGFGLVYGLIIRQVRQRLRLTGQIAARESTFIVKALQEGLGAIRDVLIDGSQPAYCRLFDRANWRLRRAQEKAAFISQTPAQLLEALGILFLAGLGYLLAQRPGGIEQTIPMLGLLVLGIRRLLPVMQQIYASWASILNSQGTLSDVLELLDQPLPASAGLPAAKPIPFRQGIGLRQLSFRYGETLPEVIKALDADIPRGSRAGFIGPTGSGKSTLLDIIMGLLNPTSGRLEIDGQPITAHNQRAWQAHIAHVPQAIFLADISIAENIALGVPEGKIDFGRVKRAAQEAQIADFIESLPQGYQTIVGERGLRLSGGQRQRVGIARALYKEADVIIFDEATSALDNQTEAAIMASIDALSQDLTVLIIAHRLTTLRNCSLVFELVDGKIRRQGSYAEIIGGSGTPDASSQVLQGVPAPLDLDKDISSQG
jgi:ATP-binding cassette subfamily B protein